MLVVVFSVLLTVAGEPAKSKVSILHSDSFFSWVRIRLATCEDQRQLVGEPLPVMQDLSSRLLPRLPNGR